MERIRLLKQTPTPVMLALPHRILLAAQTICSLHSVAPPASGDSLIVLNPKHSQSTVPRYNPQWRRLRRQPVQAPVRPTRLQAQHHLCVPGPSPLKTSAPKRLSQSRLSFSFRSPGWVRHHVFTRKHGTIDNVLTRYLGCYTPTRIRSPVIYRLPRRLIALPLPIGRNIAPLINIGLFLTEFELLARPSLKALAQAEERQHPGDGQVMDSLRQQL